MTRTELNSGSRAIHYVGRRLKGRIMARKLVFFALLAVTLGIGFRASAEERYCSDTNARTLRVEMYPYVPNVEGMAWRMKELFEAGCPGLNLQIQMNRDNYYATDNTGILAADADVYEVDSVFFDDFLKHRNPKPPSQTVVVSAGVPLPFAKQIASSNGVQFGIPHWVCTDFLVYRKDVPELGTITGPSDARRVFQSMGANLLMDLKGSSTLGELYLSILVAHYGSAEEALRHLDPDRPDDYATAVLRSFVEMEPAGFGRDRDYHLREGFYPRQFAWGKGSAFVGYAEDTYYALSEMVQSCTKDKCLSKEVLDVAPWPFADEGAKPVAWVDMYFLDPRLADAKLRDAEAFIRFMMSVSTYEALLMPANSPPLYLLPARDDMYSDQKLAKAAPLYPKFRAVIDRAVPVADEGLNYKPHQIAKKIDGLLPDRH
jgi:thiamine pyridinylase